MNVAVQLEFKSSRKEPLGDLVRRVAAAFEQAGLQPEIAATFSDTPGGIRKTSAVERAIKKYPNLARFERDDPPLQALPPTRRLTNGTPPGTAFLMADLLALADGVPRSLPFHSITIHFRHADFGRVDTPPIPLAAQTGITIGDSWWVNGRSRSLSAKYAVDAQATSKKLPDPPAAIGALLAALGKPTRSAQVVASGHAAGSAATPDAAARPISSDIEAVGAIVAKYRTGMGALVERIALPHDLPSPMEARLVNRGASGPLKPTLVTTFSPRGYDCHGGSGTFKLQRRTSRNHVLELELDVGTWSRSLTVMFRVRGPGFNATLMPPVTRRGAGQYPIGDTAHWKQIVENVAAVVAELEQTFVPEIEAAAGPAPDWFEPGR